MNLFGCAVIIFLVDRITKLYVMYNLPQGKSLPQLGGMFDFTYIQNSGAAFSIMSGKSIILIIISIVIIIAICIYYLSNRLTTIALTAASSLIIGGAAGNLCDRLLYGRVIDFIDFRFWPIFNIADMAICAGACIFVFLIYVESKGSSS